MGGTKYLKMPTDFFENEAIVFFVESKAGHEICNIVHNVVLEKS